MNKPLNKESVIDEKMEDALTPGVEVECDPEEAEELGAFFEDALSEEDAKDGIVDLIDDEKE